MNFKKLGSTTGIGDRLGVYLIYAMLAEIKDYYIYTTWIYKENNFGERGTQYPDNIHDYIIFPKRLIFITEDEYNKLNYDYLDTCVYIYHGFDYIPEIVYKNLYNNNIINCTFDEMLNNYKTVCNELIYKKELPKVIENNFGIIHMRRGDKGNNNCNDKNIINLVNKFNNKINRWIIISDDDISFELENKITKLLKIQWSNNDKIKVLEQFFICCKSNIIIQSVNYQNCDESTWSGWSGFSYVAFQIRCANNNLIQPMLISCNSDDQNTRLTYAKLYAGRQLRNIYMYNNIFPNNTMKKYIYYK